VHGADGKAHPGAVNTPTYASTTSALDSTAALTDVVEVRKKGDLSIRYGTNPTIRGLEARLKARSPHSLSLPAWPRKPLLF
jgi:O-acetylhomoserine/O-acetylserine sulfhydrylase-like pyridoxal-dependent enzyme